MARAELHPADTSTDSADTTPDALSLLTRDHRLAEELFTELGRSAPQQIDPLARRICKMLRVHTQIEEELFYPAVRRALADDSLIDRSEQEHARARESIAHLESLTSSDAQFEDAVADLAKLITEHVTEEEQQLFPLLRESSLDLTSIGIALAERRDTLLDVLGLHDDDEEGAANQRETRTGSTAERRAERRT